jgi:hypothetical protein
MKKKLALNFKETNDMELCKIAGTVVHNMTDNEYLPDPGMMIIELRELSNQLTKAISEAGRRDLEKIAIKNQVKALLIKKLKEIGAFVTAESKGAETTLLSSGFPVFKPVDEIILKQPTLFRIKPGPKQGEIIMQVRRVEGAKSYLYRWTPDPATKDSIWQSIIDTKCKKTITGLPLGVNYCFQMAAIGSNSQIIYTAVQSRYIS